MKWGGGQRWGYGTHWGNTESSFLPESTTITVYSGIVSSWWSNWFGTYFFPANWWPGNIVASSDSSTVTFTKETSTSVTFTGA
jgi:hypothetical protein